MWLRAQQERGNRTERCGVGWFMHLRCRKRHENEVSMPSLATEAREICIETPRLMVMLQRHG